METNDGRKGGLLKGDSHQAPSGGISAVIVDSNRPVLLEGGEAVIAKKAVEKYHELLSAINQSAGGVPILDPNTITQKENTLGYGGNIKQTSHMKKGDKVRYEDKYGDFTLTSTIKEVIPANIESGQPLETYSLEDGGTYTADELKVFNKSGGEDVSSPISIGSVIINNEASNDEKSWTISQIKDCNITLSHKPKFINPKDSQTFSFERFLQLFNDGVLSIPTIDALGLENFEAKKLIVGLAIKKLEMECELADVNRRIGDALEETKRAKAELTDEECTGEEPVTNAEAAYIDIMEKWVIGALKDDTGNVIEDKEAAYHKANIAAKSLDEKFDDSRSRNASTFYAKGGTIPSLEKHWKGLNPTQVEEYADYLGNLKMMWNKKEISLNKQRLKEIVAYQIFINENYPEFNHYLTKQKVMGKGGNIPNNYEGLTATQVWEAWDYEQKRHFLADHHDDIYGISIAEDKTIDNTLKSQEYAKTDYVLLPSDVTDALEIHVSMKQYGEGGNVGGLREVRITYENGDVVETNMAAHLTDDDIRKYYAIGKEFNLGSGGKDLMSKVKEVEILYGSGGTITTHAQYESVVLETIGSRHYLRMNGESWKLTDAQLEGLLKELESVNQNPLSAANYLVKRDKSEYEKMTFAQGGNIPNFTQKQVINNGYTLIKSKLGDKKAKKYFEQADILINPNENEIVEYRENGIVTKEGDKYTFHALADMGLKTWRVAFKNDVTEQFAEKSESSAEKLLNKLKTEGKLKRYFDTRGNGKKSFETIIPNKKEKGFWKRYESLTQGNIGVLQNEMLDEADLLSHFERTSKN